MLRDLITALGVSLILCAYSGPVRAQDEATPGDKEPEVAKPKYLQSLSLPASGDRLRFSSAVHTDLHVDETFVADLREHRIVIFDKRGVFLYEILGGTRFRVPRDIAVDPDGYIYVVASTTDGPTVLRLDFDGLELGTFFPVLPSGNPPELFQPESIAVSPDGARVYTVDGANHVLWITRPTGDVIRAVDLRGDVEDPEELRERFYGHVDVYGDVVLLAVPAVGHVWMFDLDGNRTGRVGFRGTAPCQTMYPAAAALDENHNVIVIDHQRVIGMVWRPSDNKCLTEFSGIGNAPGRMYQPKDVALDKFGRIYISQGFEGRVQVFEGHVPAYNPDRKRRRRRQGDTE